MIVPRTIAVPSNVRYGPLQPGFEHTVGDGYQVLIGPNNSGKSALLQWAFTSATDELGPNSAALLLSDRDYVMGSTETAGLVLEAYNGQLAGALRAGPRRYENYGAPTNAEFARLFLTHTDFRRQLERLDYYLSQLEFPPSVTRAAQTIHIENVPLPQQGSGLRSVFPIISALTDDQLRIICIDEPELSLEPQTQRLLRDLLVEAAHDRIVLIATHSHLFLDRANPDHNHIVRRAGELVSVDTAQNAESLYDASFRLLGNSTADLWFPSNYWVVEGASDQVIAERILELIDAGRAREVKVVASGGVDRVNKTVSALEDTLRPLVMRGSPYAGRVVALVDQAVGASSERFASMGDRFYVLEAASLEEYLPEALYARASREKAEDLAQISKLANDHAGLSSFKRQLSEQIAAVLSEADLDLLSIFAEAATRALDYKRAVAASSDHS